MLAEGVTPDFIIVDGAEGGTAAAPLEYEDNIGLPLTDGLMIMHNALVGTGLRDRIRIGAGGKVAPGNDIIKRLIQGADYTNSARSMMMAAGCNPIAAMSHQPLPGRRRNPGSVSSPCP
jgi:glutamate synthase domain-containing protein 2